MAETKKYYWLKLKDDFFRDKRIKKLRRIAGGDTYTVIYLKMQLLSIKNNGVLIFEGLEDNFAEELALELDEDTDNVKVTLAFLQGNGMIEETEQDHYLMTETIKCIGSESASAERVRKHRKAQKALQCNTAVTNCNTEKEKEKDIEIDIDIEKEIEKEIEKAANICYAANDDLNTAIISFIDFRKTINKPLTDKGIELLLQELNKLAPNNIISQIDIINQSILNGWQGIFPLKDKQPTKKETVPAWMRKESSLDLSEYDQSTLESYVKEESASNPEFMERKAALEERLKEKYGKGKKGG